MRDLKPLTILALGLLLTGVATTLPFLVMEGDARNVRGLTITFMVGAAFGLVIFVPIAFAERFRVAIHAWLEKSGSWVQGRVALVMAAALGYWVASMRHQTFDVLSFIAMGVVFIGAVFGVVIGVVNGGPRTPARRSSIIR